VRPPFGGTTVGEIIMRHVNEEPPPLESVRPDMPPQLWLVIKKLLAKRPEDRYQTPADLILALTPFNRRASGRPTPAAGVKLPISVAPKTVSTASTPTVFTPPANHALFAQMTKASDEGQSNWRQARRRRRLMKLAAVVLFLAAVVVGANHYWP